MKVLITGAGGHLAKWVERELEGYNVVYLTTRKEKADGKRLFHWNPSNQEIDSRSLSGVQHVVHLAGKSINSRWTDTNKRAIRESRIRGAQLIFNTLKDSDQTISSFISAGGIAVYGDGWLSEVCRDWEDAARKFSELGARTVVMRLPVLIDKNSAFIKTVKPAARFGLAVSFGSKYMKFPWVHTRDVARFVKYAIESNTHGEFPLVAKEPTQGELQKVMARKWAGFHLGATVPSYLTQLIFGAKSEILLSEHDVITEDLLKTEFKFLLLDLNAALDE